jgi:uncharacterized SAM-binding protein YcdF (DUF218 family)
MKVKQPSYWKQFYCLIITLSLTLLLVINIICQSAIARYQQPTPQAILTLGGYRDREEFTAQFARFHLDLPIWVSTGSPPDVARKIFQDAEIINREVYLDRRATDTVTNFTTLVADFKKRNFKHIYVITSDFHLPRSKAIAFVILGSQGMTFTSVSIPSNNAPESKIKIVRDVARAFIWIVTKRTGSRFNNRQIVSIIHLNFS